MSHRTDQISMRVISMQRACIRQGKEALVKATTGNNARLPLIRLSEIGGESGPNRDSHRGCGGVVDVTSGRRKYADNGEMPS